MSNKKVVKAHMRAVAGSWRVGHAPQLGVDLRHKLLSADSAFFRFIDYASRLQLCPLQFFAYSSAFTKNSFMPSSGNFFLIAAITARTVATALSST